MLSTSPSPSPEHRPRCGVPLKGAKGPVPCRRPAQVLVSGHVLDTVRPALTTTKSWLVISHLEKSTPSKTCSPTMGSPDPLGQGRHHQWKVPYCWTRKWVRQISASVLPATCSVTLNKFSSLSGSQFLHLELDQEMA